MNIKTLLLAIAIATTFTANCQGAFEIKVTVNKEYLGNYLEFYGNSNSKFPLKLNDTSFTISGICKNKFEPVIFRLQQSDALSLLNLYISSGKMELTINHLYSKDTLLDIKLKDFPFQKEQEEYLKMTYAKKNYYGILNFINKYPKSYISYYSFIRYVLNKNLVTSDSLKNIFVSLNDEYKASESGEKADSIIKQKIFAANFDLGKKFLNFEFKTISNNTYNLSDFTQKGYVLICYWASWCTPCRKNIPRLKEINKQYASKGLQLISISIDDNEKYWKDALEKEQMPWTQVCDIEKYVKGISLRKRISITQVPQYYLLDKNGTIVYNNFILKDDENYSLLFKTLEKYLSR